MIVLGSVVTGDLIIPTVTAEFAEEVHKQAKVTIMGGILGFLLRAVGKKYDINMGDLREDEE